MKQILKLQKYIIPVVAIVGGLIIGLGIGQFQLKKEQKIFHDKLREASKKMSFIQKKMSDDKTEATASLEMKFQSELEKLENEKKALSAQAGRFKDQANALEIKVKEIEEAVAKTKKELQDVKIKQAQALQQNKDLERDLKKMTGEKNSAQAELKKTTQNLGRCGENNVKLAVIAEDLMKAYRNKGIGKAILEKEPLTQIKKVEVEQLLQQYREEIEQQKFKQR